MKAKSWVILEECIEEGLKGFFWNEEIKEPKNQLDVDRMTDRALLRIQNAISEKFDFDE